MSSAGTGDLSKTKKSLMFIELLLLTFSLGILQKMVCSSASLPQITNFTSGNICSPQESLCRMSSVFILKISVQIFFGLLYPQICASRQFFYFVNERQYTNLSLQYFLEVKGINARIVTRAI